MADQVKILGVSGSLRKGSYNTAALRAAVQLAPEGMTFEIADISEIPLYNDDVFKVAIPEPAKRFRDQIAAADGILFVSPEYNYSVPGHLKNAIDWASRPPDMPFSGKPAAIMGASGGMLGTARMQYHLRQISVFLNLFVMNRPEVMIGKAPEKFDAEGNLTDEMTKKVMTDFLKAFHEWTLRFKK